MELLVDKENGEIRDKRIESACATALAFILLGTAIWMIYVGGTILYVLGFALCIVSLLLATAADSTRNNAREIRKRQLARLRAYDWQTARVQ